MNGISENSNTKVIGLPQTNRSGDVFFSNLNGTTFNKIDANTLFNENFSKLLFHTFKLYIIIGTDSGLLPRFVESEGTPKGTRYLFIEPAPIFKALKDEGVLSGFSDSFSFADELVC